MTIIQEVRDVLEANAGNAMTTAEIEANLKGIDRAQINSALWRLRTEDDHIKQVRTGVHKYLGPSERKPEPMPKLEKLLKQPSPFADENAIDELRVDEHMYFTQVGVAENGDLILSRDSDTKVYRATPV